MDLYAPLSDVFCLGTGSVSVETGGVYAFLQPFLVLEFMVCSLHDR